MTDNPVSRKAAAAPWWVWAALVLMVGGVGWLLVTWAVRRPAAFVAYTLAAVGFGGLGVLSARFPSLRHAVESAFTAYWRVLLWMGAVVVPLLLARTFSAVVAASPLVIASALLVMWFALFCVGVGRVSTEAGRKQLWASLSQFGRAAPFVYAFVLAGLAIVLFATLAFVLSDRELIRFGTEGAPAAEIAEPADALDFFTWHLLDAIPALDVPGTLRWDEPLTYDDGRVGALVLVFKIVAVGPIVAAFASFWSFRRKSPETAARPDEGGGRLANRPDV